MCCNNNTQILQDPIGPVKGWVYLAFGRSFFSWKMHIKTDRSYEYLFNTAEEFIQQTRHELLRCEQMKRRVLRGLGDRTLNISPFTLSLKLIHSTFLFKALHWYEQHHMPLKILFYFLQFSRWCQNEHKEKQWSHWRESSSSCWISQNRRVFFFSSPKKKKKSRFVLVTAKP